jgi:hypothetical protein
MLASRQRLPCPVLLRQRLYPPAHCYHTPWIHCVSCSCPCPAPTSTRSRRCLRARHAARGGSQQRLSRGSQWTVTGPLLDFHCPLICPYDWISHPSLGHCDHYAANYEGALYSQVFFSASRGRSGFVFQRCSPDDTTLSESGYASMTL